MKKVKVKLKSIQDNSYTISIASGALSLLPEVIRSTGAGRSVALVMDTNAASFHGERVRTILGDAGIRFAEYLQPSGEEFKTRAAKERIEDFLFASGLGRGSILVAVGGGVTGDMAGFTAATFMRGIPIIQVPTTLLSQVDSSVGGKTGLDTPAGKNMVGAFHQPSAVVIDPSVLLTLEDDEFLSGLGEVLKHALLFDRKFYDLLMQEQERVLTRDLDLLTEIVRLNCRLKAAVVKRDARESEYRKTLNLGHTFAHALESVSAFQVKHGIAVLHGLCAEVCIAAAAGWVEDWVVDAVFTLVDRYLPVHLRWQEYDADALLESMRFDKKNRDAAIYFSFIEKPGKPLRIGERYAQPVDPALIRSGILRFVKRFCG